MTHVTLVFQYDNKLTNYQLAVVLIGDRGGLGELVEGDHIIV